MEIIKKGTVVDQDKLQIEKAIQWKGKCTCEQCNTEMIISILDFSDFTIYCDDVTYYFNCPVCGIKRSACSPTGLPLEGVGLRHILHQIERKESYQINERKRQGAYYKKNKYYY